MKPSDVLIVIGALGVAAALAALLGGGWVSQAMLPLAAGGVAGFVGERIKDRRKRRGGGTTRWPRRKVRP
ncbi:MULTISPECIES: hypothetical protein [unclassified Streptomyces]|uniref:hypothetical protein n=1 Tax=unclassified Streptomyces TaxID=2593676 RepID=UPI000978ED14|nr:MULTISPECIES: hypothetical protein [unclassified Streptomyces]ONI53800.1 hypothetical protein STIB_15030 [Streptomyces sp. IB2014 011-1]RDV52047.1 hypothetical protein DDV98_07495 [Streptomyces sp. IB2014 011-12]